MFGTVEASEEVVAHGSPRLAREVRQTSAPPTSNPAEPPEKGLFWDLNPCHLGCQRRVNQPLYLRKRIPHYKTHYWLSVCTQKLTLVPFRRSGSVQAGTQRTDLEEEGGVLAEDARKARRHLVRENELRFRLEAERNPGCSPARASRTSA